MAQIRIISPLSGQAWPLERVPDPVFAQKMVGDGLSIDPVNNVLLAACDGEILSVHAAGHAVTLRTPEGLELIMHVGIDTVTLKGEGFMPRVKAGDRVSTGAPLIEFDLDYLATHAKSLLTQIVVANSDRVTAWERASGIVTAGKDTLFTVTFAAEETTAATNGAKTVTSEAILIPNRTGLHARPAAVLANLAKSFQSAIKLQLGDRSANARSVTAIMALEVSHGAKVQVIATGADAATAVEKLAEVLAQGCGDEGCTPAPAPATTTVSAAAAPPARRKSTDPDLLVGVSASPGLAVGEVFQVRRMEIEVQEAGAGVDIERHRLENAIATAQAQLSALRASLHAKADPAKAAIFAAHEELLSDPDLLEIAESAIAKGKSAAFGWKKAVTTHADRLAALRNELLAQRANDLRDVGLRVLALITGTEVREPQYPANAILIAEDLTPSDTATLDRSRVVGFCTTRGGATSHVAILARSLGIPALAGVEPAALDVPNGTPAILDASIGTLRLRASAEQISRVRTAQQAAEERRKANQEHALEPAVTTDGMRMEILGNIGGVRDAAQIAKLGGEGVGLLRSEFLFMERSDAPSEEEQFAMYKAVAEAIGPGHPIIIRTLDVGGDKPLPYLPIPKEDNPFLGERGIRVCLDRPEILRTQLRAILRAAAFGDISVMFPMITTLEELRDAKAILVEEAANLNLPPVPAGIMVEVPATAVMAAQFAREADFFSIGTNDLTQYALAMDRGHPKLAPKVDGLNPAILKLIGHTVNGARSAGKRVGVCGGIATDASAVPLLIGLGVDELSVSLPAIPAVKAQIRTLSMDACRKLAEAALAAESADDVRALVRNAEREPSMTGAEA
ncbi:phosphoenolpyruvate--protein phosphotransferase [Occallatibacter riparius]|uniref:phosphoenolpyruvate--protein phosphotransferase n=1 Tax=Occallatibacter riparius TaxID=1002689 RepID=A0A9J7BKD4_9BACT|nr:phosphoenolpyruvate--protein phosphotransferase [Occallatibacter riparius]UWZ83296.1 phosphoenolpyruvate--protein phosphotransferase [Occallatibacter riparius]